MAELHDRVSEIRRLPEVVIPNSTISIPGILDETRYCGFSIAEILEPVATIPVDVALEVYEQLVWLKFNGDLSKPIQTQMCKHIDTYLGAPLRRQIQSDTDSNRSIVTYLWSLSKSLGVFFTIDRHNAHIELHNTTLGFVGGVLMSKYVNNVTTDKSLYALLRQSRQYRVRRSPLFCALMAATRSDPEVNGLLVLALVLVGTRGIINIKPNIGSKPISNGRKNHLWEQSINAIWKVALDPIPLLRDILVPVIMTPGTFRSVFPSAKYGKPPGDLKRRRLVKMINTIFEVEGKDDETLDRDRWEEKHGKNNGR